MKALFEVTFSGQDDVQVRTEVAVEASLDTYLWLKGVTAAIQRLDDLEAMECSSFSLDSIRLITYLRDN